MSELREGGDRTSLTMFQLMAMFY